MLGAGGVEEAGGGRTLDEQAARGGVLGRLEVGEHQRQQEARTDGDEHDPLAPDEDQEVIADVDLGGGFVGGHEGHHFTAHPQHRQDSA